MIAHQSRRRWSPAARPRVLRAHRLAASADVAVQRALAPPPAARSIFSRAGALLDATLIKRAHAVAAVSPLLTQQLRELVPSTRDRIRCVLPPWQSANRDVPFDRHATERARLALGLDEKAYVWLYRQLEAYQGWRESCRGRDSHEAWCPSGAAGRTGSDPREMLAEAESRRAQAREEATRGEEKAR